jgi:transposase
MGMTSKKRGCETSTPSLVPPIEASPLHFFYSQLRQWAGRPVPPPLRQRILRAFQRWTLVGAQVRELENQLRRAVRDDATPEVTKIRRRLDVRGIGPVGTGILVREVFAWRQIKNRRELASLAGLTPSPDSSGQSQRAQGISKAGSKRVRWIRVELAWGWLHYQPESDLSRWYQERFGQGTARLKKVGIVALARTLWIALWRSVEFDEWPAGAVRTGWEKKLNGREPAQRRVS